MEFKIGDKVRFLNEKGGGIVTRLISPTMVEVAIEEGFEVPVAAADLIKIEPGGAADRFFDRPVNVKTSNTSIKPQPESRPQEPVSLPEEVEDENIQPLYRQSGAGIVEGIYLLYEPSDQKWLITGNLEIYLVNNTSFDAIYSFILDEGNNTYAGVGYDIIPAYSRIHIETITREDIEPWSTGTVQVLFYNTEMSELIQPLHSAFKVKPTRFFKETSYQDYRLTGSKAVVLFLGDLASLKIMPGVTLDKTNVDLAAKLKVDGITPTALIDRHRTGPREAEVDLHISALRNDYSTMTHHEILVFQVDYFTKMLESAIAFNYQKVVFIHGIGNGTLKSAIIDKIKDYETIELRKASFALYGNGAIEIIIHSDNRV